MLAEQYAPTGKQGAGEYAVKGRQAASDAQDASDAASRMTQTLMHGC